MEHYTVLGRVGEGAHGIVMRARHNQSGDHMSPTRGAVTCWRCIAGQIVALKKIPLKRLEDGISEATIREIRALQQLDSVYIVKYGAPTPTDHPHPTDGRPVQAVRRVPPGPGLRPRVRVPQVRPGGGHQGHGAAPHPARDQVRRHFMSPILIACTDGTRCKADVV